MHVEQHKWYSPSLFKEMEIKVYGHYGKPLLIFPTQGGSFHEAEDYHMIDALQLFINEGRIKVFTVDSVDHDAWANEGVAVHHRGNRHEQYNSYLLNEVVPFIKNHCNVEFVVKCNIVAIRGQHFFDTVLVGIFVFSSNKTNMIESLINKVGTVVHNHF